MIIRPQRYLCESLTNSARLNPDKIAVVIEGVSYSYAELLQSAQLMAHGLISRGLQRGHRSGNGQCLAKIRG